jgi:hypothetical protein
MAHVGSNILTDWISVSRYGRLLNTIPLARFLTNCAIMINNNVDIISSSTFNSLFAA